MRCIAVVLLLTLYWVSAAPHTAAAEIQLDASLPPELAGCVDTRQLRASYAQALAAYGGEDAQTPSLRLRVTYQGPAEQRVLELSAFAPDRNLGRRELPVQASDCAVLPRTLAVVLDLLAQSADAATESTKESVALSVGGQLLFGVLPNAAVALQLRAATTWRPVTLRLAAVVLVPQQLPLAEGSIRWQSYELVLEACSPALHPAPWLALRACIGPRAGIMVARSERFALQNQGAGVALIYAGAQPEASLRLGPDTHLQLAAGIAIALVRPQFVVGLDGGQRLLTLDSPSPLRAEIGLSVAQNF